MSEAKHQRRTWFTQYCTSEVAKNVEVLVLGKDFELILTVKIEPRHPIPQRAILVVSFGRSVITAELWQA